MTKSATQDRASLGSYN